MDPRLQKYLHMRDAFFPVVKKEETEPENVSNSVFSSASASASTVDSKASVSTETDMDTKQYDTDYIETKFKMFKIGKRVFQKYATFYPVFKQAEYKFTLCDPLFHEERQKQVHEWLLKFKTSKYLDIMEETAINAKRLEELSEGFSPLTTNISEKSNLLQIVEQERR